MQLRESLAGEEDFQLRTCIPVCQHTYYTAKCGRGQPLKRKKKILPAILLALLALLCIGGMELVFCARADPALFERITAPAVAAAEWAGRGIAAAASRTGQAVASGAVAAGGQVRAALSTRRELSPAEEQVQTLFCSQGEEPPTLQTLLALQEAAKPPVTELQRRSDGREILTGGVEMVYYNQKDEAWAQASFGSDPVGTYGCGPTALSMAVSSLTEFDLDPAEMAAWCAEQGYQAAKSGSYLTIVQGTAEAYGLSCRSLPIDDGAGLLEALRCGGVAVALMGPGHFTEHGHFILLHGVTEDGQILVADPNSRENSLTPWDAQLILDELSPSRSGGSPLWLLTEGRSLS